MHQSGTMTNFPLNNDNGPVFQNVTNCYVQTTILNSITTQNATDFLRLTYKWQTELILNCTVLNINWTPFFVHENDWNISILVYSKQNPYPYTHSIYARNSERHHLIHKKTHCTIHSTLEGRRRKLKLFSFYVSEMAMGMTWLFPYQKHNITTDKLATKIRYSSTSAWCEQ
jgi:hypothetical protein